MESGNASAQSGTAAPAAGNLAFVSFSPDQVRASTLIGQELYGSGDDTIGEVSDLVLQSDGKTRAALVDVGGFLGIGEKRVSIPFDQIQMQEQPAAQTGTGDMTAAPSGRNRRPRRSGATVIRLPRVPQIPGQLIRPRRRARRPRSRLRSRASWST
jgi:sporulation protein YlmC with PRC-barrel domain